MTEELRRLFQLVIDEHENLEDRAPVDALCGDCNMGTGPHRAHCPYHTAVRALKVGWGATEEAAINDLKERVADQ